MVDPSLLPGSGPSSDVVEEVLRIAFLHAEEGAWDQAAEVLREALREDPEDPYLLCWLGLTERELGMDGIAYERFKGVLATDPDDPVLLATAGTAVAAFDDPAAEPALRSAALLAPDLPQARWMYGAYLAREGMIDVGLGELTAAVELDPEDPVIHLERGVAQALMGDLDSAHLSFARSVELDAEKGWGLVLLGLTALQSGDLEEARRRLDEGARLRPEDIEAQLLSALAHSAAGWDQAALEMLERGRLSSEGVDTALVTQIETQIDAGPEAALEFLQDTLAPSSFRARLMARP